MSDTIALMWDCNGLEAAINVDDIQRQRGRRPQPMALSGETVRAGHAYKSNAGEYLEKKTNIASTRMVAILEEKE